MGKRTSNKAGTHTKSSAKKPRTSKTVAPVETAHAVTEHNTVPEETHTNIHAVDKHQRKSGRAKKETATPVAHKETIRKRKSKAKKTTRKSKK